MKLLVVEDENKTADYVRQGLTEAGFVVDLARNGLDGHHMAMTEAYDLIMLDVMLPDIDGWRILQSIRAAGNQVPVLFLTARGNVDDRVQGLELGADDYLPKPFNPRELVARIKAVLRRQAPQIPGAPTTEENEVTFGDFVLSLSTRELKRGDEVHMLTSGEFSVLKALVHHPRVPLTRDKLMQLARGREWDALERSIDVQISRLRRLLEPDPSKPRYIQTVWGVGYVFVPDGQQQ